MEVPYVKIETERGLRNEKPTQPNFRITYRRIVRVAIRNPFFDSVLYPLWSVRSERYVGWHVGSKVEMYQ